MKSGLEHWMLGRSLAWLLGLLLGMATAAGCGGPNPARDYGGEDGKKVADLISEFEDLTNKPKEFAQAFAAGVAPKGAAQKKYNSYQYRLVGRPTVSGETATATITIEKPSTGDKIGEKTWEFAKEGGTWKIKAAPLP